jgi:hypothetical protein
MGPVYASPGGDAGLVGRPSALLPHHRDAQPLFRRDQVVDVLRRLVDVDLHPPNAAVELASARFIVVADRGGAVAAEIRGLVPGEHHRHCRFDPPLADPLAVEGRGPPLAEAAAVVVELDPDLVLSGRDRLLALDLGPAKAEEARVVYAPNHPFRTMPARDRLA